MAILILLGALLAIGGMVLGIWMLVLWASTMGAVRDAARIYADRLGAAEQQPRRYYPGGSGMHRA